MTTPTFPKPVVVISKCLEFDACRYDGQRLPFDLVSELAPHVTFEPVCPEVEIGLGVPRETIRLVASGGKDLLVQPATGSDLTEDMTSFSARYLDGLERVDGFILKNRSPSCGVRGVKIYRSESEPATARYGPGLFARAVLDHGPKLAIEDEGRLRNYRIREHFFTKLFGLARLREVGEAGRMRDLVQFQARYKFVLLGYSEAGMRRLGRIVANPDGLPFEEVYEAYGVEFAGAMSRTPRYTSMINVFQHIGGFFRKRLSPSEKAHFSRMLARYRAGGAPAGAVIAVLQSWAVRFEEEYLLEQAIFEPYPEPLVSVADSGKGRSGRR